MNIIIDNWYIIVGILAVLACGGFAVYKFAGLPTKSQIAKIKEWLKYAVTLAEKDLGSSTGQLKLRYVYDLFTTKFPIVAKIVSFKTFSAWVDEALVWLNEQLESNEAVKKIVEGDK